MDLIYNITSTLIYFLIKNNSKLIHYYVKGIALTLVNTGIQLYLQKNSELISCCYAMQMSPLNEYTDYILHINKLSNSNNDVRIY